MAKQNILLVDDDAQHLRVMEVSLRNAGHAVTTATDGATALTRAAAVTPDLIIADTELPVLDGFGLCSRLKQDPRLAVVPFLFLSEDASVESKVRGLELGADDYLVRPIYTRELVARVRMALNRQARARAEASPARRRFFGSLGDMSVVDLVQTMSVGEKSGTVRVDRPGHHATLWFRRGRLIDANTGTQTGEDAVYRVLTWETGDFEIDFREPKRPPVLEAPTAALLMEGLRRVDEWNRICEQLPALDAVFEVDYEELAERLAELPDEANALLRMFDGRRTALDVIDDSDVADLEALGLLSRLYFEGIIRVADDVRARSESAARPAVTGATPAIAADPEPPRGTSLADALIRSATGARPAVPDPAPARKPSRRAAPPPPPEPEHSTWGDLGEKAKPARIIAAPEPEISEPEPEDFPALPDTQAVADDQSEDLFFGQADDAVAAATVADDPLWLDDDPIKEPLPKVAYVALGILGVAVVGGILFFALRDVVEPKPLPEQPRNGGWHRALLANQAPLGGVKAIDVEWRIPSEPGGGEAPKIPEFEDAPAPAPAPDAQGAAANPETPVADAPPAAPEAPAAPDPAPAKAPTKAPAERVAKARPAAPAKPPAAAPAEPEPAAGGDPRTLIKEGQALYRKGKYKPAAEKLEKALALAPNNKAGLVAYAKALLELKRLRDALEAAERAARVDPGDAEVYLLLADARQSLGRVDGAIKAYDKYLSIAPNGTYAAEVKQIVKGLKLGGGD